MLSRLHHVCGLTDGTKEPHVDQLEACAFSMILILELEILTGPLLHWEGNVSFIQKKERDRHLLPRKVG